MRGLSAVPSNIRLSRVGLHRFGHGVIPLELFRSPKVPDRYLVLPLDRRQQSRELTRLLPLHCRDYNAALSNTLIRAIPACPDSCPVLTEPRPPSPIFSECPHKRRTSSECPSHRKWAETTRTSSAQQFQQSRNRRRNPKPHYR